MPLLMLVGIYWVRISATRSAYGTTQFVSTRSKLTRTPLALQQNSHHTSAA